MAQTCQPDCSAAADRSVPSGSNISGNTFLCVFRSVLFNPPSSIDYEPILLTVSDSISFDSAALSWKGDVWVLDG